MKEGEEQIREAGVLDHRLSVHWNLLMRIRDMMVLGVNMVNKTCMMGEYGGAVVMLTLLIGELLEGEENRGNSLCQTGGTGSRIPQASGRGKLSHVCSVILLKHTARG